MNKIMGISKAAGLIKAMPLGQAIQIMKSELTGHPDTVEIEGELVVTIINEKPNETKL